MGSNEGSRFVRDILGGVGGRDPSPQPIHRTGTSRFARDLAGRVDAGSPPRLKSTLGRLSAILQNNALGALSERRSAVEPAIALSTANKTTSQSSIGSNARLVDIVSASPTTRMNPTSEPALPAFEKLMRRPATGKPESTAHCEIRLPSAPAPSSARNSLSIEFDPEMDELFDQVWVKVQRRLARSVEDTEESSDDQEIRHHNIQSMVVTSWSWDEGCSTSALGLAARSAASAQGRVCLVDADFHDSGLTKAAGAEGQPGLSELLAGEAGLDEVLIDGPEANLSFLPAGRNPGSEALSVDSRIQNVIGSLEERFRYVFYDASSLKRGVEAYRWGRFVVNAILIVRAGRTRRQTILHAVESMQLHGMRLLGTVLNHRVDTIPSWLYPYV